MPQGLLHTATALVGLFKAFRIDIVQVPLVFRCRFPADPLAVGKVREGHRHGTQGNRLLGQTGDCHPGGYIVNINGGVFVISDSVNKRPDHKGIQTAMAARGTASKETLRLLGIGETDKTVIFSIIREDMCDKALSALEQKFKTIKNGKGIAYTVPMTGTIGVAIYRFLSNTPA